MKLDVLTFVAFQAPISFVPLFIFMVQSWQPGIWAAFEALCFGAILQGGEEQLVHGNFPNYMVSKVKYTSNASETAT